MHEYVRLGVCLAVEYVCVCLCLVCLCLFYCLLCSICGFARARALSRSLQSLEGESVVAKALCLSQKRVSLFLSLSLSFSLSLFLSLSQFLLIVKKISLSLSRSLKISLSLSLSLSRARASLYLQSLSHLLMVNKSSHSLLFPSLSLSRAHALWLRVSGAYAQACECVCMHSDFVFPDNES
jgi:hypothetical protein